LKTKLIPCLLIAALLLAGCSPAGQAVSPSSSSTGAPGPSGSSGTPPAPGAASGGASSRATLPAVPALATPLPSLDGLYFTPDLLIENHGESLRVLAGFPCEEVVALLSSGQWRLVKDIPLDPKFAGYIPGYTLLERNGEYLLLKSRDILPQVPATPDPAQVATVTPTAQATPSGIDLNSLIGCQVNISKIVPQPFEAHGVEEVQGPALGYPLGECLYTDKEIQVNMSYEGPGDFRLALKFQVPNALGEQPVSLGGLSVGVLHFSSSYLDYYEQYLRNFDPANTTSENPGITFSAGSETPGTATVTSLVPFAGLIQLDSLLDENSNPQTFQASFDCGW
jgi:hypothetical protein